MSRMFQIYVVFFKADYELSRLITSSINSDSTFHMRKQYETLIFVTEFYRVKS